MHVKKQQLEPDMEQQTGSKLGKEYVKAVYCQPAYITYTEYNMRNCRKNLESTLLREISITSDMQMTPPLWQKAKQCQTLFLGIPKSLQMVTAAMKLKDAYSLEDGGGIGQGEHFLPHKFIKRTFKRRLNSTKKLLNAGRGHQAPRKATHCLRKEWRNFSSLT